MLKGCKIRFCGGQRRQRRNWEWKSLTCFCIFAMWLTALPGPLLVTYYCNVSCRVRKVAVRNLAERLRAFIKRGACGSWEIGVGPPNEQFGSGDPGRVLRATLVFRKPIALSLTLSLSLMLMLRMWGPLICWFWDVSLPRFCFLWIHSILSLNKVEVSRVNILLPSFLIKDK